jgi:hypothetical protein
MSEGWTKVFETGHAKGKKEEFEAEHAKLKSKVG